MKIEQTPRGKYLLIKAVGRLDASWSEYFRDTVFLQIREGHHHLVLDASEMVFLSSAGIRALLQVHKELGSVSGGFSIVSPTDFVRQTLSTSGFEMWLADDFPADMLRAGAADISESSAAAGIAHFVLDENAPLSVSVAGDWRPWQVVDASRVMPLWFSEDTCALGIGSAAGSFKEARDHFGEFLAVGGNVVFQPPDEQAPADYLIAEKQFSPRMLCIQALAWQGALGHLIRFFPAAGTLFCPVSELFSRVLTITSGVAAGFVILGEIEGLVGTALNRSPGQLRENRNMGFPEIRDWLSFCGERSYSHHQALLAGIVAPQPGPLLPVLPSAPEMAAHTHGAVFPYQPLPNGKIDLYTTVDKFFKGPPPVSVMHLTDDHRSVVGLGQSALIRGACWFGPIQNPEVLL